MADIVNVVKTTTSSVAQLEILKCFLTEPGSFMFDSVTSSRSLSNMISHVSSDWIYLLEDAYNIYSGIDELLVLVLIVTRLDFKV